MYFLVLELRNLGYLLPSEEKKAKELNPQNTVSNLIKLRKQHFLSEGK